MSSIPFNNARGAASLLQMAPPFAFSDVTMSVFPLRASLPTLENFCRNYLNQAPDLVQFRPFIPYVYLVILDYGRMSIEAANMGWISQREVAFGIPMRWMNNTGDGLEFHDWAFTSPFIFVDNELSMATGREVFGWPKLLVKLDPSVSEWVRDPHGARRVFQVSAKGAAKGYEGELSEYRSLLSVYQHRTAGLLDIPPSLSAVSKPLSQMAGMTASMSRLSVELTKTFLGMASDGITGSAILPDLGDLSTFRLQLEPEKMKAWLDAGNWTSGLKNSLWSMFPRMYANTINFKQFRDTAEPHRTCYQAITSAKMPVTSVKEGGFLGPQNMLMGQLDGGFHIEISNLAGLPIVDSLGLEVESERVSDGTTVSRLAPVAPLWLKVDMTYGLGETVIWRGRRNKWNAGKALEDARMASAKRKLQKDEFDALVTANKVAKEIAEQAISQAENDAKQDQSLELDDTQGFDYLKTMNRFNTARGASEAVGGSFSAPDASVRVLPLKAKPIALQKFVDEYLSVEDHVRFEAWGDFVYLLINDFKTVNSQQSGLSKRRAREVTLLVPVKCYSWYNNAELAKAGNWWENEPGGREEHGREKLLTTGFVNAFTFVDDVETSITANEVFGVPSMGSTVAASENDWLSRDRGSTKFHETILKMRAKVLPELMAGAKAIDRTLIEVCGARNHSAYHAHEAREKSVNRWVELLADDLHRKEQEAPSAANNPDEEEKIPPQEEAMIMGQSFALELLAGELPFNQFSLKQFRDSAKTDEACYQGLVQRRVKVRKIKDISELPGPLHISITDFPTQPITELLGLIPKYSYPGKDRVVRVFEPIRPFSFNGDLVRGKGMTLFERIGSENWQAVELPQQIFGWRKLTRFEAERLEVPGRAEIEVGRDPTGDNSIKHNKIINRIKPKTLKKIYSDLADKTVAEKYMIRQRNRRDTVRVLSTNKEISEYQSSSGLDLSAWVNHALETEKHQHSQSEVAARIERVSPATVIDKILSRQWGKTKNSRFYDHTFADFCIPVGTVPKEDAKALFPQIERQGKYWPQSNEYRNMEELRWRDETNAFRYELQTSLRMLALIYTASLAENGAGDLATPEEVFNFLADQLNELLDSSHRKISQELIDEFAASVGNNDDNAVVVRMIEELVFVFFEAHLPDKIKLRTTGQLLETSSDGGGMVLSSVSDMVSRFNASLTADEWEKVASGLNEIYRKMDVAHELMLKNDLDLSHLVGRAHNNWARLQEAGETRPASELLRMRLAKKISGK